MDRTRIKLGETSFAKEEAVVMHFLLLYPRQMKDMTSENVLGKNIKFLSDLWEEKNEVLRGRPVDFTEF